MKPGVQQRGSSQQLGKLTNLVNKSIYGRVFCPSLCSFGHGDQPFFAFLLVEIGKEFSNATATDILAN
jgi:hypothetical protein